MQMHGLYSQTIGSDNKQSWDAGMKLQLPEGFRALSAQNSVGQVEGPGNTGISGWGHVLDSEKASSLLSSSEEILDGTWCKCGSFLQVFARVLELRDATFLFVCEVDKIFLACFDNWRMILCLFLYSSLRQQKNIWNFGLGFVSTSILANVRVEFFQWKMLNFSICFFPQFRRRLKIQSWA